MGKFKRWKMLYREQNRSFVGCKSSPRFVTNFKSLLFMVRQHRAAFVLPRGPWRHFRSVKLYCDSLRCIYVIPLISSWAWLCFGTKAVPSRYPCHCLHLLCLQGLWGPLEPYGNCGEITYIPCGTTVFMKGDEEKRSIIYVSSNGKGEGQGLILAVLENYGESGPAPREGPNSL